jgi:hypothetical protein
MEKAKQTKSEEQEEVSVWKKQRKKIKDYSFNEDWEVVIDIFEKRIENKFFEPLRLLKDKGNNEGSGFSMVAIECLLIELFAAFREGKVFNVSYCENSDPPYQYKDCQTLYVDFLTTIFPFNKQFSSDPIKVDKENKLFPANEFYTHVRCGLLHEGKTKGNWTINLKPGTEPKGIFLGKDGKKLKIYRTILLKKLENYLTHYASELRGLKGDEEKNKILRRNFARKMDHLYETKSKEVEWWKWQKHC